IDGRLRDGDLAACPHDLAVGLYEAAAQKLELRYGEPRFGDRNRGADVEPFRDLLPEIFSHAMAPRVERDDAAGLRPLCIWTGINHGCGVGEVRPHKRIERA